MSWNKKKLVTGALITVTGAVLIIWMLRPVHRPVAPAKFNTISDSSIGFSFNMSKSFEQIPRDELASMNPGFSYGFRPANDQYTTCIVSQTKLISPGEVSPVELRDGLLKEVRSVHPDAELNNPETATAPVLFGRAQGVLLQISYNEAGQRVERIEIIALGKTAQVIAYCQSLAADSASYYEDFTTFFSSLKLD